MRKLRPILAAFLVFVFFSSSVLADGMFHAYEVTYTVDYESGRSMLDMINSWRTSGAAWYWNKDNTTKVQCGKLQAFTYDYNLEQIAYQRAYEIIVQFAHERPDGTMCFSCEANGTKTWGECIAYGYESAYDTYMQWREDEYKYEGQGHRRNMASKDFTAIGIAHIVYQGIHYWVQEYGYENSGAAATPAKSGTVTGKVIINTTNPKNKVPSDGKEVALTNKTTTTTTPAPSTTTTTPAPSTTTTTTKPTTTTTTTTRPTTTTTTTTRPTTTTTTTTKPTTTTTATTSTYSRYVPTTTTSVYGGTGTTTTTTKPTTTTTSTTSTYGRYVPTTTTSVYGGTGTTSTYGGFRPTTGTTSTYGGYRPTTGTTSSYSRYVPTTSTYGGYRPTTGTTSNYGNYRPIGSTLPYRFV